MSADRQLDAAAVVDPITAEIIRHALRAIPGQIDANIVRTAYSPLVYEYKDYAVGIVDHEGRLVSQSQGALPIFVANALGVAVKDGLELYGVDGIHPGDLVISNHAGTLGQHLNNVVMYAPIFVGENKAELFGFMSVLVHWLDVGGSIMGSMSPNATEVFQEGIQFRSIKLHERGRPNIGLMKTIECNTRLPRELMGDVGAQIAGCLRGVELVTATIDKYGFAGARAAVEMMWDRSERASRAAVEAIPDGDYHAQSELDDDGVDLGRHVHVEATVRVRGDRMTIDLTGTAAEVRGAINSGREGGAVVAARIAFKYLAQPFEPADEGTFRPLAIEIPDGTFLSASPTAAVGNYSTPLPTVVDTILRALVQAIPDRLAAGHHGTFGVHMFSGIHPETGERYQNLDSALGGWGATCALDGVGPFKTLVHGDTLDVPVEVQEALYPIRITRYEFATDSGGAGRHRGAPGLRKDYDVLAPCQLVVLQEREATPPWGVLGGLDGASSSTIVHRTGKADLSLRKAAVDLTPGDRITVLTGGGGGFGPAGERDPAKVASDVRQGIVSSEAAWRDYGFGGEEEGRRGG